MLKRIVSLALEQPLFLGLLGALHRRRHAAFRALPVEAFPDVTDIQVTVITLFPGHAPEEVEKQVTIPLEIALSGLPHRGAHVLAHAVRPVVPDPHLRRQGGRLLRAPAGARAAAEASTCPTGVKPQLAPLSTPDRRGVPLPPDAATASSPTELRTHPGLGRGAPAEACARRRRRRQLRRLHQAIPGEPRTSRSMKSYGVTLQQVFTALDAATPTPAAATRAGRAAVPDPRHRPAALARRYRQHRRRRARRHAVLVQDIADVDVGAVPRQGTVGAGRRRRNRHRHRADAQGRESVGGAGWPSRSGSTSSTSSMLPKGV